MPERSAYGRPERVFVSGRRRSWIRRTNNRDGVVVYDGELYDQNGHADNGVTEIPETTENLAIPGRWTGFLKTYFGTSGRLRTARPYHFDNVENEGIVRSSSVFHVANERYA